MQKGENGVIISASSGENAAARGRHEAVRERFGQNGGEVDLENYAKAVLYAYPLLSTVEKDYEEHIRNKALLSYDSRASAEELAEYLAGELLKQQNLSWLRVAVEKVLQRLSEDERTLLSIRYFGKKRLADVVFAEEGKPKWNERTYFRRQTRLAEKVGAMLKGAGVTEDVYRRCFRELDVFRKIDRFVTEGKDSRLAAKERGFWQTGARYASKS